MAKVLKRKHMPRSGRLRICQSSEWRIQEPVQVFALTDFGENSISRSLQFGVNLSIAAIGVPVNENSILQGSAFPPTLLDFPSLKIGGAVPTPQAAHHELSTHGFTLIGTLDVIRARALLYQRKDRHLAKF
jgi:hypothetical protein